MNKGNLYRKRVIYCKGETKPAARADKKKGKNEKKLEERRKGKEIR